MLSKRPIARILRSKLVRLLPLLPQTKLTRQTPFTQQTRSLNLHQHQSQKLLEEVIALYELHFIPYFC